MSAGNHVAALVILFNSLEFCPTDQIPGEGVLWAKYLLPCCCIRDCP